MGDTAGPAAQPVSALARPATTRDRARAARCVAALALALAALCAAGAWFHYRGRCYRRRFAYATMLTKHLRTGAFSPCYKAALALLLLSWLATNSSYPLLLMATDDLDDGLQAIVDLRPGAIIPMRVEQLQQDLAQRGDLGAMATKLHLWELGAARDPSAAPGASPSGGSRSARRSGPRSAYDQIAYYDSDHLFLSNADRIFDDCGCSRPFCGTWEARIPAREFPVRFGSPLLGNRSRQLINAGMLVIRPEPSIGRTLREWWARRAEILVGEDAHFVLTGSDQTWFNFMMGADFTVVRESYNVGHVGRAALLNANGTDFARVLTLDGAARDPSVGTVVHTKPWLRGRSVVETAFHRALLARFGTPYVRALLSDRRCHRDRPREVMRVRSEDLARPKLKM
ncbi:hypothetical protein KFE25_002705 [Diacronema lutheri]|uniref:Nucleotide-diphospho-sugar transferase domain-containing protein n=1 Tax=Diacronema lutheri TaxID=2081491 RepID=A0A8J6CF93_DIALT|nr:hypothetical protein KFE25_002705 [Diacronema lutheri]